MSYALIAHSPKTSRTFTTSPPLIYPANAMAHIPPDQCIMPDRSPPLGQPR